MALYDASSNKPNLLLYSGRGTFAVVVVTGKRPLTLEKRETCLMSVAEPVLVYFVWVHVLKSLDSDSIDLFCIGAIRLWVVQILS